MPTAKNFDSMLEEAKRSMPTADENVLLLAVMSTLVRKNTLNADSSHHRHTETKKWGHQQRPHRDHRSKSAIEADALREIGNRLFAEGLYEEATAVFAASGDGTD
jgi:hypothetical protein